MYLDCLCIDGDDGLSDDSYSGIITEVTVGENVAFKDVLYLKNDSKFWKADADAEATADGLCVMACETILADAKGKVMVLGFVRDDDDNWTAAGKMYISTTPGGPTQTAPSGSGDIVRIIGYATHADRFYFNPSSTYEEIA